jgi:hypothetical protein
VLDSKGPDAKGPDSQGPSAKGPNSKGPDVCLNKLANDVGDEV